MKADEFTSKKATRGYRVKQNMTVSNLGHALLYSLRKDHKDVEDPTHGPPTKPVYGGSAG